MSEIIREKNIKQLISENTKLRVAYGLKECDERYLIEISLKMYNLNIKRRLRNKVRNQKARERRKQKLGDLNE